MTCILKFLYEISPTRASDYNIAVVASTESGQKALECMTYIGELFGCISVTNFLSKKL